TVTTVGAGAELGAYQAFARVQRLRRVEAVVARVARPTGVFDTTDVALVVIGLRVAGEAERLAADAAVIVLSDVAVVVGAVVAERTADATHSHVRGGTTDVDRRVRSRRGVFVCHADTAADSRARVRHRTVDLERRARSVRSLLVAAAHATAERHAGRR